MLHRLVLVSFSVVEGFQGFVWSSTSAVVQVTQGRRANVQFQVTSPCGRKACFDGHWLFPCRLDQMFSDAFSKDHQLIQADPRHSLYLACALIVRGNVQISDLRRNIERFGFHF